MPLETLRLEASTGATYDLTMIDGIDDNQRKDAVDISPPGRAPRQNILLGVSGMSADVSVAWWIHNDGTDKSNGTAANEPDFPVDTVTTLNEQIVWLRDYVHAPDFDVSWTLTQVDGPRSEETVLVYDDEPVFIESMDLPTIQNDSPKWLAARLGLRFGSSFA